MKKFKTLLIWMALIGGLVCAVLVLNGGDDMPLEPFGKFIQDVQSRRVAFVNVDGRCITVTLRGSEEQYRTFGPVDSLDDETRRSLMRQGAQLHFGKGPSPLREFAPYLVAVVVAVIVIMFLLRRMKGASGGGFRDIMALGQSRARLISETSNVTFADVGGCQEAKQSLRDVVDFLRDPTPWVNAGARLPRGVLLEGPPGCGKTLLARAVAGETSGSFFFISASEFVEMFVGVGAARVRDLFEQAAKKAPAVIFIDELDAVGKRRGSGIGSAHDEREQTLNQLLVSLDGFENDDRVVVMAATNRPDTLDSALLRPGRFDRVVKIPPLDRDDRMAVLAIHAKNKPLGPDVHGEDVADRTQGFNGSELENLLNEAALLAVRRSCRQQDGAPTICADDLTQAMAALVARRGKFTKLDTVLIESASQLTEPTGKAVVRLTLPEEVVVEGEVVWADASFIKLRNGCDTGDTIVPKRQIRRIEILKGTESADAEDLSGDLWAGQRPDLA